MSKTDNSDGDLVEFGLLDERNRVLQISNKKPEQRRTLKGHINLIYLVVHGHHDVFSVSIVSVGSHFS